MRIYVKLQPIFSYSRKRYRTASCNILFICLFCDEGRISNWYGNHCWNSTEMAIKWAVRNPILWQKVATKLQEVICWNDWTCLLRKTLILLSNSSRSVQKTPRFVIYISKRIYLSAMNMECNTKLGYITPYNYWKRPLRTNGNNMLTSLRFKDKLIWF